MSEAIQRERPSAERKHISSVFSTELLMYGLSAMQTDAQKFYFKNGAMRRILFPGCMILLLQVMYLQGMNHCHLRCENCQKNWASRQFLSNYTMLELSEFIMRRYSMTACSKTMK